MKNFVLLAISLFVAMFAQAQETDVLMATLQHGGKTTVFIGYDAFKNAYNAAADSADIITLSSGSFRSPGTISKSITVFGAGFEHDTINDIKPTIIVGNVEIRTKLSDAEDEDGYAIKVPVNLAGSRYEGLSFGGGSLSIYAADYEINDIFINKCDVGIKLLNRNSYSNVCVSNSYVRHVVNTDGRPDFPVNNMLITNSYIESFQLENSNSTLLIDHCIIKCQLKNYSCTITNSVLIYGYGHNLNGTIVRNNIFFCKDSYAENLCGETLKSTFAEEYGNGDYSADKSFALKYPQKYPATDGTEIGLYGGLHPWNKIPCIPRIIESSIDTKTSADGKLKISIKAEAQAK